LGWRIPTLRPVCALVRLGHSVRSEPEVVPLMHMLKARLSDRLMPIRTDEEGQAIVEYALILGLLAAVAVTAVQLLGVGLLQLLTDVASKMP
jgi:Flp pilus assembly pilin Flp